MPNQTVYERVQNKIGSLTKSEKKVARVLLSDYPTAGLVTVAELSTRSAVSGQTIIRFANSIGFNSYPQFQSALIAEIKERNQSPLSLYSDKKSGLQKDHLFDNSLNSFKSTITKTISNLSLHEFNEAIKLISDKRFKVITTGGRFSELMADYLQRHLNQLRPETYFQDSNPVSRGDIVIDINKKTLLIVFDTRRYQADTISFAKEAHERGATIILITDPFLSPICQFANVVLTAEVELMSPFDSQHAILALTEMLIGGLLENLSDDGLKRIEEIEAARNKAFKTIS